MNSLKTFLDDDEESIGGSQVAFHERQNISQTVIHSTINESFTSLIKNT